MAPLPYTLHGPKHLSAVLFLHGFMGCRDDWDPVSKALSNLFCCIAVDLPGHGDATRIEAPEAYSMDGAAQSMLETLDAEGVERAAVVGYSMGGRLALYFALAHPERTRRLVLESASPGLASAADREARRGVDEARAIRLEKESFDDFLRDWYRQPLFETLAHHPGLTKRLTDRRRGNDPPDLARSLRGMGTGAQQPLWDRIPELSSPTLAVAGALDGKFAEIAERMAVLTPRIRTAIIPNAGHNVHLEYPQVYLDLLKDFLVHP